MLEKPALPDDRIAAMLRKAYTLRASAIEFLPLGADANTAVYRVAGLDGAAYFLKLRSGAFAEASVTIPYFLRERGIPQIIAPLKTNGGRLWTRLDTYACILYPFIAGRDGFELALSDGQWLEFGQTLKAVHAAVPPARLQKQIAGETFSPFWREQVQKFQAQVEQTHYVDPIAAEMAAFMQSHRAEIDQLVERAAQLGADLQSRALPNVLCHSDIHAGNLLLAENGSLYIVDWDNPIAAPKERDLMFIGGGIGDIWNSPREEALFYKGYGRTEIDHTALAYYRYERIVEDIAAFCDQILPSHGSRDDRERGWGFFTGCFQPGEVIEIARKTDPLSTNRQ